jgi:hypothetical protein
VLRFAPRTLQEVTAMPKAPIPLRTRRLFEPARYSHLHLASVYLQLVPGSLRRVTASLVGTLAATRTVKRSTAS